MCVGILFAQSHDRFSPFFYSRVVRPTGQSCPVHAKAFWRADGIFSDVKADLERPSKDQDRVYYELRDCPCGPNQL